VKHPWFRTMIEVHKDETPCVANSHTEPRHCPLVGTGIHESVEQHLARVHGTPQTSIDSWAVVDEIRFDNGSTLKQFLPQEQHVAIMENIHEMLHGREAPNDIPEVES